MPLSGRKLRRLEPSAAEFRRVLLRCACRQKDGKTFGDPEFDGQSKEAKRSNLILLNGRSHLNLRNRLSTELKDGDEISLLPVVVGDKENHMAPQRYRAILAWRRHGVSAISGSGPFIRAQPGRMVKGICET